MEGVELGRGLWWVKVLSRLKLVTVTWAQGPSLPQGRGSAAKPSRGLFLIPKMQRLRTNSPTLGGPARSVGLEVSEYAESCHPRPLRTQSCGGNAYFHIS